MTDIDLLVANEKLTQEITALEAKLRTAGTVVPPRPANTSGNLDQEECVQANHLLVAHKAKLELLGKLVPTPHDTARAAAAGKPMTATELCLAVKSGAMSIEAALAARQKREPAAFRKLPTKRA